MHLDSAQEKILRGDMGEAKQFAMEIVTKVGDAMEADFRPNTGEVRVED